MTVEEHSILSPCSCGNKNVEPKHKTNVEERTISIWIECQECGETSPHSHTTYLDAATEWNKIHKK